MSRRRESARPGVSKLHIVALVSVLAIASMIAGVVWPALDRLREKKEVIRCRSNLKRLGLCMYMYAQDNDGVYPDPHRWCDLLIEHTKTREELFVCLRGTDMPSNYAMNPNADPNGPSDLVLLFDTKGGWNQYGGPEMLTFDNHRGKYCNIVFVDCHVDMVRPDEVGRLKWEIEKETKPEAEDVQPQSH